MRALKVFLIVSLLHFTLSVIGTLLVLPAAFETQQGFWAAPGKAVLAWLAAILLAPLAWLEPWLPGDFAGGFGAIAIVSVLSGAAAAGLLHLWLAARR